MKTKEEFIQFLKLLPTELNNSKAEINDNTNRFLEALVSWLEDTSENPPDGFDWEFVMKLMTAGVYYE